MTCRKPALVAGDEVTPVSDSGRLDGQVSGTGRMTRSPEAPFFVVLDDDPTGTQAVYDLPVILHWEVEDLAWAMGTGAQAVYVMTNSRSLEPDEAARVVREVATHALEAAGSRPLRFISRSDSTLRGHFPLETDVLGQVVAAQRGCPVDATLLIFAFPEAGRITRDGIHYARIEGRLVPVGETEYAADATFGYSSSSLLDYVAEKSHGRVPADSVVSIDHKSLGAGVGDVERRLASVPTGAIVAFDAADEDDLKLITAAVATRERKGNCYVYRVGPSFVRARLGMPPRGALPLRGETVSVGGLIIVGSHVSLTQDQVRHAQDAHPAMQLIEMDARLLAHEPNVALDSAGPGLAAAEIRRGRDVILQTSRRVLTGHAADGSLTLSRMVSRGLAQVVRMILAEVLPAYVIAKGGITSSDVAKWGLGMHRATILGTVLDGVVALWEPLDGPAQGVPYAVFPGNAGTKTALAEAIGRLRPNPRESDGAKT